jgi:hypothetical protein
MGAVRGRRVGAVDFIGPGPTCSDCYEVEVHCVVKYCCNELQNNLSFICKNK